MKRLRVFSMLITLTLIVAMPNLIFADEAQCCNEFQQHCDDWCSQNGHGTGMITNCWGWQCMETCWCTGLCGGQHCQHEHPGGTYCTPCAGN